MVRGLEAAFVGGAIAGFAGALASRIAMRAIAMAGGTSNFFPSGFTLDGTFVAVLLVVGLPGIPLAVPYVALRRFLPRADLLAGLVYGLALLATIGVLFLSRDSEFARPGTERDLGRPLFAAIFPLYGIVLGWVVGQMARSRAAPGPAGAATAAVIFAALASVALFTDLEVLSPDPPLGVSSLVRALPFGALVLLAAVGSRGARTRPRVVLSAIPAVLLALAGLAVFALQVSFVVVR